MIARMGMCGGRRAQPAWHVDSVNGSDGNDGRSTGAALRTIGAVAAKIRPGDTVALACGSQWRETLTVPADAVKVVAYGSGAKPLLDCSDAITPTAGPYDAYVPTLAIPANAGQWSGSLCSCAASGVAPNGGTAYKLAESQNAASSPILYVPVSLTAGTYYFSVFCQAGERNWAWVGTWDSTNGHKRARFNLATGVVGGADTGLAVALTPYPNGWYRVDLTITVGAVAAAQLEIGIVDGALSTADYGSSAGCGVYVWYPSATQATGVWSRVWQPVTGLPASLTTWTTFLGSLATDTTQAPDGTSLAVKFKETADVSPHAAYWDPPTGLAAGSYAWTVWLLAAERTWAYIYARINGGTQAGAWVNLATGAVGTQQAGVSVTVQAGSGGWYRYTLVLASPSGTVTELGLATAPGDASLNQGGAAGSGIYAWYTSTSGQNNVYQAVVPIDYTAQKTFVSVWENNTRLVLAQSTADCNATPGSYYPSAVNTSPITLYLNASDGSNPAANGKTYEYSRRQRAYVDGGANCVTTGIWTRRNLYNDGSLVVSGKAYGCLASEGSLHNVYVVPGAYLESVVAQDAYYVGQNPVMFVFNANVGNGEAVTFVNCTALCSIPSTTVDGFYGHVNTSGAFGLITFRNCTAQNLRSAFDAGSNATDVLVDGCTATTCIDGVSIWVTASATVRNCVFSTIQRCIQFGSEPTQGSVISGCSLTGTGGWASTGIYSVAPQTTVQDCVFNGTNAFAFYGAHGVAGRGAITSLRNTFNDTGEHYYGIVAADITSSDYNTFNQVAGNKFNIGGVDMTYAAYKTATGQDSHSTP